MFLRDRKVSSFGCFVFDFCVLRFRVLGASLSSLGCFVFEFWCFVFEIWVLRASVFVFECFVFETTLGESRLYKDIQELSSSFPSAMERKKDNINKDNTLVNQAK